MSNNVLMTCKFIQQTENAVNVDIEYLNPTNKSSKTKTVELKSFIDFIKNYQNTDVIINDTEFLTNNLIRKVSTVNVDHYFFFYDKILSSLNYITDKLDVVDNVFKEKIPYFNKKINITYTNILFHFIYNKSNENMNYVIYFVKPEEDLFGPKVGVDLNSTLLKNFMPNAFSDSICWGNNVSSSRLLNAAKSKDIAYLSSLPFIYFNSKFNNDLFFNMYRGRFNVLDKYLDETKFIENLKTVLLKYLTEVEYDTVFEKLKNSNSSLKFKYLIPIIINEPLLYKSFIRYLELVVSESNTPNVILTLKKLCDKHNV